MHTALPTATHTTPEQTWPMLLRVGAIMGEPVCWLYEGEYHFRMAVDGWTLAVSPDDAGRFRVSACRGAVPTATVWVQAHDSSRLEAVVRELREQAEAVLSGA